MGVPQNWKVSDRCQTNVHSTFSILQGTLWTLYIAYARYTLKMVLTTAAEENLTIWQSLSELKEETGALFVLPCGPKAIPESTSNGSTAQFTNQKEWETLGRQRKPAGDKWCILVIFSPFQPLYFHPCSSTQPPLPPTPAPLPNQPHHHTTPPK